MSKKSICFCGFIIDAFILEPYLENIILSFPCSPLKELHIPALNVVSANLLLAGTKLSLKQKVNPVINIERAIAGEIILEVFMPNDFNANNSELADNFPYANKVESKTAMGKDKTRKLGKLKKSTFNASNKGRPNSTIFLIRSNITPTDKEITVKADMANIIGGIICPNNHLSINGIEYQGEKLL